MEIGMTKTLTVSSRGQITLPANLRKRLGVLPGDVLEADLVSGELRLRPRLEIYDEAQIADWDSEDLLSEAERRRLTSATA